MWPYFTYNNISYNLRKGPIPYLPSTHSTYYGTNYVHFRGSLIQNNLARDIKSSKSLYGFKTKIKNFGNIDCRCLICCLANLYFKFTLRNNKSIIVNITNSHSMIKPILKDVFLLFYFCHGVCNNNYFELSTILLLYFVGIYQLWLSLIPTVNKDLNK